MRSLRGSGGTALALLAGVAAIAGTVVSVAGSAPAAATAATAGGSTALVELPYVSRELSAFDGYVVYSLYQPAVKDWRLVVWHAGQARMLPVPARSVPFDAEVGSDVDGQPAVVYSHCRKDPVHENPEELLEPDWQLARGCQIFKLDLPDGRPRLVRGIYAADASDSTPAISDGNIAFARLYTGERAPRVYLWRAVQKQLVRLGGGPGPCAGSLVGSCKGVQRWTEGPAAWVDEMSLSPTALAYRWVVSSSTVQVGVGSAPEIRVDPLHAEHQSATGSIIAVGYTGGACGFSDPSSADATATGVFYIESGAPSEVCEQDETSFQSFAPASKTWRRAWPQSGVVLSAAVDDSKTYWLRDVPSASSVPRDDRQCASHSVCGPATEGIGDCEPDKGTCTLMVSNRLPFGKPEHRQQPSDHLQ